MIAFSFSVFLFIVSCVAQQNDSTTEVIGPVEEEINGICPSAEEKDQAIEKILALLKPCPCSGPGQWRRVASLNMSDPHQQCPTNWNLITTPIRTCGRTTNAAACDSAIFPSNGQSYSRVCGRVYAYQRGTPEAFAGGMSAGLEQVYVDGLSLTHGPAGSRQHIWTFASALYETDPSYTTVWNCACTNTDFNWPHQVPSFVGNNYFCDTGNSGPGYDMATVYTDDPLWDGEGCGPTNACCQFNNPPWFCTTLSQPTTDDIELRICADRPLFDEDTYISIIEIYVM